MTRNREKPSAPGNRCDTRQHAAGWPLSFNEPTGALLSRCETYRYILWRNVAEAPDRDRLCLWVMCNPSTANALVDDATIRRCKTFTRDWGFTKLVVVNLWAFRATQPRDLFRAADPVGPDNDRFISGMAALSRVAVCAWGANALPERARAVVDLLRAAGVKLYHLGLTGGGHPKHPLRLARTTLLTDWTGY